MKQLIALFSLFVLFIGFSPGYGGVVDDGINIITVDAVDDIEMSDVDVSITLENPGLVFNGIDYTEVGMSPGDITLISNKYKLNTIEQFTGYEYRLNDLPARHYELSLNHFKSPCIINSAEVEISYGNISV